MVHRFIIITLDHILGWMVRLQLNIVELKFREITNGLL